MIIMLISSGSCGSFKNRDYFSKLIRKQLIKMLKVIKIKKSSSSSSLHTKIILLIYFIVVILMIKTEFRTREFVFVESTSNINTVWLTSSSSTLNDQLEGESSKLNLNQSAKQNELLSSSNEKSTNLSLDIIDDDTHKTYATINDSISILNNNENKIIFPNNQNNIELQWQPTKSTINLQTSSSSLQPSIVSFDNPSSSSSSSSNNNNNNNQQRRNDFESQVNPFHYLSPPIITKYLNNNNYTYEAGSTIDHQWASQQLANNNINKETSTFNQTNALNSQVQFDEPNNNNNNTFKQQQSSKSYNSIGRRQDYNETTTSSLAPQHFEAPAHQPTFSQQINGNNNVEFSDEIIQDISQQQQQQQQQQNKSNSSQQQSFLDEMINFSNENEQDSLNNLDNKKLNNSTNNNQQSSSFIYYLPDGDKWNFSPTSLNNNNNNNNFDQIKTTTQKANFDEIQNNKQINNLVNNNRRKLHNSGTQYDLREINYNNDLNKLINKPQSFNYMVTPRSTTTTSGNSIINNDNNNNNYLDDLNEPNFVDEENLNKYHYLTTRIKNKRQKPNDNNFKQQQYQDNERIHFINNEQNNHFLENDSNKIWKQQQQLTNIKQNNNNQFNKDDYFNRNIFTTKTTPMPTYVFTSTSYSNQNKGELPIGNANNYNNEYYHDNNRVNFHPKFNVLQQQQQPPAIIPSIAIVAPQIVTHPPRFHHHRQENNNNLSNGVIRRDELLVNNNNNRRRKLGNVIGTNNNNIIKQQQNLEASFYDSPPSGTTTSVILNNWNNANNLVEQLPSSSSSIVDLQSLTQPFRNDNNNNLDINTPQSMLTHNLIKSQHPHQSVAAASTKSGTFIGPTQSNSMVASSAAAAAAANDGLVIRDINPYNHHHQLIRPSTIHAYYPSASTINHNQNNLVHSYHPYHQYPITTSIEQPTVAPAPSSLYRYYPSPSSSSSYYNHRIHNNPAYQQATNFKTRKYNHQPNNYYSTIPNNNNNNNNKATSLTQQQQQPAAAFIPVVAVSVTKTSPAPRVPLSNENDSIMFDNNDQQNNRDKDRDDSLAMDEYLQEMNNSIQKNKYKSSYGNNNNNDFGNLASGSVSSKTIGANNNNHGKSIYYSNTNPINNDNNNHNHEHTTTVKSAVFGYLPHQAEQPLLQAFNLLQPQYNSQQSIRLPTLLSTTANNNNNINQQQQQQQHSFATTSTSGNVNPELLNYATIMDNNNQQQFQLPIEEQPSLSLQLQANSLVQNDIAHSFYDNHHQSSATNGYQQQHPQIEVYPTQEAAQLHGFQLIQPTSLINPFLGQQATSNINGLSLATSASDLNPLLPFMYATNQQQPYKMHYNKDQSTDNNSNDGDSSSAASTGSETVAAAAATTTTQQQQQQQPLTSKGKKRSSDFFASAGQLLLSALPLLLAPTLGLMFASSSPNSVARYQGQNPFNNHQTNSQSQSSSSLLNYNINDGIVSNASPVPQLFTPTPPEYNHQNYNLNSTINKSAINNKSANKTSLINNKTNNNNHKATATTPQPNKAATTTIILTTLGPPPLTNETSEELIENSTNFQIGQRSNSTINLPQHSKQTILLITDDDLINNNNSSSIINKPNKLNNHHYDIGGYDGVDFDAQFASLRKHFNNNNNNISNKKNLASNLTNPLYKLNNSKNNNQQQHHLVEPIHQFNKINNSTKDNKNNFQSIGNNNNNNNNRNQYQYSEVVTTIEPEPASYNDRKEQFDSASTRKFLFPVTTWPPMRRKTVSLVTSNGNKTLPDSSEKYNNNNNIIHHSSRKKNNFTQFDDDNDIDSNNNKDKIDYDSSTIMMRNQHNNQHYNKLNSTILRPLPIFRNRIVKFPGTSSDLAMSDNYDEDDDDVDDDKIKNLDHEDSKSKIRYKRATNDSFRIISKNSTFLIDNQQNQKQQLRQATSVRKPFKIIKKIVPFSEAKNFLQQHQQQQQQDDNFQLNTLASHPRPIMVENNNNNTNNDNDNKLLKSKNYSDDVIKGDSSKSKAAHIITTMITHSDDSNNDDLENEQNLPTTKAMDEFDSGNNNNNNDDYNYNLNQNSNDITDEMLRKKVVIDQQQQHNKKPTYYGDYNQLGFYTNHSKDINGFIDNFRKVDNYNYNNQRDLFSAGGRGRFPNHNYNYNNDNRQQQQQHRPSSSAPIEVTSTKIRLFSNETTNGSNKSFNSRKDRNEFILNDETKKALANFGSLLIKNTLAIDNNNSSLIMKKNRLNKEQRKFRRELDNNNNNNDRYIRSKSSPFNSNRNNNSARFNQATNSNQFDRDQAIYGLYGDTQMSSSTERSFIRTTPLPNFTQLDSNSPYYYHNHNNNFARFNNKSTQSERGEDYLQLQQQQQQQQSYGNNNNNSFDYLKRLPPPVRDRVNLFDNDNNQIFNSNDDRSSSASIIGDSNNYNYGNNYNNNGHTNGYPTTTTTTTNMNNELDFARINRTSLDDQYSSLNINNGSNNNDNYNRNRLHQAPSSANYYSQDLYNYGGTHYQPPQRPSQSQHHQNLYNNNNPYDINSRYNSPPPPPPPAPNYNNYPAQQLDNNNYSSSQQQFPYGYNYNNHHHHKTAASSYHNGDYSSSNVGDNSLLPNSPQQANFGSMNMNKPIGDNQYQQQQQPAPPFPYNNNYNNQPPIRQQSSSYDTFPHNNNNYYHNNNYHHQQSNNYDNYNHPTRNNYNNRYHNQPDSPSSASASALLHQGGPLAVVSSSNDRSDSKAVNDYLKKVQFSDSDRDKLMASYLTCDGLLNDNDHCLERLSCEFSDPQNIEKANKLDRAVSSILLGHILINTYIPNQFKLRLKSASLFGYTQSGKCSKFVCNKLTKATSGSNNNNNNNNNNDINNP